MSKSFPSFGTHPRALCIALGVLCAAVPCTAGCERPTFVPGNDCELNSNCESPLVCRIGRCRIECRAQRDCPLGLECVRDSNMLGACLVPDETTCTLSSQCREMLVCRFGRCTNACAEDVDCPPGAQCVADDDGMLGCRDSFERQCTFNAQCMAPLICAVDSRCRPECRETRDCREGLTCNLLGDVHVCAPPTPGADGGALDGAIRDGGVDGGVDGGGVDGGDAGVAAVMPPPLPLMAAGIDHSCAAVSPSDFRCWGANTSGQIGDNSLAPATTPYRHVGLTNVQVVGAGSGHTCVATATGLFCWGSNSNGQVGAGAGGATRYLVPNLVSGLPSAPTDLALGNAHTCAIASARLFCWGDNSSGQLGIGDTIDQPAPVEVTGLAAAPVEVSAFINQTCVRFSTGRIQCFGANNRGQIGDGSTELTRLTPSDVVGITDAVQVAAGNSHTCALRANGQVLCWGDNNVGQLGLGTRDSTAHNIPVATNPLSSTARQLALGSTHTCARTDLGVECWGENLNHQCGSDNAIPADRWIVSPRPVVGVEVSDEVGAGSLHTCVRMGTALRCFGDNSYGQLGDGSAVPSSFTPVSVSWP